MSDPDKLLISEYGVIQAEEFRDNTDPEQPAEEVLANFHHLWQERNEADGQHHKEQAEGKLDVINDHAVALEAVLPHGRKEQRTVNQHRQARLDYGKGIGFNFAQVG